MEETTRAELTKGIYEQHWLHARHVENQRLWFANIYRLVAGALFRGLIQREHEYRREMGVSKW